MRKATLVSVILVAFFAGSAFGFFLLSASTSRQAYALAFTQQGACGGWGAPWSVALNGHTTVIAPPNTSLPSPNSLQSIAVGTNYQNDSVILFHVTDGAYTYAVSPSYFFSNGTVTISGADTVVTVFGPYMGCTTQSST